MLQASPTSAGAFGGGQIRLGFDPSAIYQYSQGIQNPNAAPIVQAPQETTTPQAVPQTFDDPVYTPNWSLDTPPVVVRIPEGFNPANPSHAAAAQQAYQTAYDEKALGEAALEFLANADAKKAQIQSASDAVAKYSRDVQRLETQRKIGKSEIPTQDGMVALPMGAKETARNLADLGAAKQGLAQAEKTLATASEPVRPKVIQVQLPAEAPQQPAQPASQQPAQQENLPSAKEEVEGITDYPQDKWHRQSMAQIYNWARQAYATPGVKHGDVDAQVKMLENSVNSQWVPEVRYLGGKMWRYDAPGKAVEVADKAGMVKDIFGNHVKEASKMISGTQQLDQMIDLAKEAADPKTPKNKKNEIYLALQGSYKAVTSAISGTSDAVQQQEFLRLNAPLDALNFYRALVDPASTSKFLQSNPQGFANAIEGIRKIASSRALQQYDDAEKIHKQFPDVYSKSALPTLPEYMKRMRETSGAQIIQKNRPQQQQATPIITKGGTGFTIQKR